MSKRRGPRRDEAKERFWRKLVAGFDSKRTTVRRWCAQHGVSEPSFYAWRRVLKLREREPAAVVGPPQRVRLLPVVVAPPAGPAKQTTSAKLIIRLTSGVRLHVTVDQLPAVLDVLESRSC